MKSLVAAAAVAMLAACGGGEGPTSNVEAISSALQARAQAQEAPSASVTARAETIFQAAQSRLPTLLVGSPTTSSHDGLGLLYRTYSNGVVFAYVAEDKGAGLQLDGIYVLGGPFTRVTFVAKASDLGFGTFPATTTPGSTGSTGSTGATRNLTVQLVSPVATTINVGAVPAPNTGSFCGDLAADTTFKSIAASGGGTLTINSCSFDGTTGTISATLSITSPVAVTIPYTVKYIFS